MFTHETDNDSDGSYLVYILDKILQRKSETAKLGLFEIGAGKYSLHTECKSVLFTLFEVLEKIENQILKEIKIYV